jgi:hypothetical protein
MMTGQSRLNTDGLCTKLGWSKKEPENETYEEEHTHLKGIFCPRGVATVQPHGARPAPL